MTRTARKISYEEFVADPAKALDGVGWANDALLVERGNRVYTIQVTDPAGLPIPPDPETVRRVLRETAGGFKTPDREAFLRELREARRQDSKGRPE